MISRPYTQVVLKNWRNIPLWAIEIKLTSNPSTDELKRLNKAADWIKATRRILICRIAIPIETETILITHPKDWLHRLLSPIR